MDTFPVSAQRIRCSSSVTERLKIDRYLPLQREFPGFGYRGAASCTMVQHVILPSRQRRLIHPHSSYLHPASAALTGRWLHPYNSRRARHNEEDPEGKVIDEVADRRAHGSEDRVDEEGHRQTAGRLRGVGLEGSEEQLCGTGDWEARLGEPQGTHGTESADRCGDQNPC